MRTNALLCLITDLVWPPSLLEAAFFFCYSSTALAGGYSCVTLTLTLTDIVHNMFGQIKVSAFAHYWKKGWQTIMLNGKFVVVRVGVHQLSVSLNTSHLFFFFWWGLLHGPQQGPDRMKEKTYKTGKRKTPA